MNPLIVVDIESGGLDANKHSITSVALVVWTPSNPIVKYKQWFILEEDLCISSDLIKATNIDVKTSVDFDKLRKDGRSPRQVCQEIRSFLLHVPVALKATLVGHNPGVCDYQFLQRLFRLGDNGIFPFSHRTIDTFTIAKFLELRGLDLPSEINSTSLFKHFNIDIPPFDRHTALGDALATAKLLTKLLEATNDT